MNILITGALGYIGSHVAVKISEENHNLTLIDNLANSSIKNLKNIEKITRKKIDFFKLDIRNEPKVKKIIDEKNIEAIFHFAGLKSVKNSEVNPDDYFDVNVNGSKTLFDMITNEGVISDWREPDVIRVAPVPLYNNHEDLHMFYNILKKLL